MIKKESQQSEARKILSHYEPIVDCVADLFGPTCEVVLHDIRDPSRSVIKIRNGHITGRTIGSPLTDLGLEILNKPNFEGNTLGNYLVKKADGKTLKSNAVMIRDDKGKIIGHLCINMDITPLVDLQKTLDHMYISIPVRDKQKSYTEHYGKDVPTLIRALIDDVIKRNGRGKRKMSKDERLRIVRELYNKKIFDMRGAVSLVAKSLSISNVSVYKYLEEIRY